MTVQPQPRQYRPGDVANGYVLTVDGRWVPLPPPQQQPMMPRPYMQPAPVIVQAPRQQANHLLHLILTILTLGLWAPVWIIVTLSKR